MNKLFYYFNDFLKFRFLLEELVRRDLVVKYKRSVLGILWSILQPLFIMSVMVIVFSQLFKSNVPYYSIYVLIGKIMWDLFSQTTTFGMNAIIDSSDLLKKIYIPKYIFPLSKSIYAVINCFLSMIGLFALLILLKVPLSFNIFFIIFPIMYMFLFSLGLAYFLSTYTVFFRDISYLFDIISVAWMYLSALFYTPDILREYSYLLYFNPVYRCIEMFRDIVLYQKIPTIENHIINLLIGLLTLFLGLYVLKRNQDKFILYF